MKKRCILKQMREAGLAQVGLQISPKWAIFSRMDWDHFEQVWSEILKKRCVLKQKRILHILSESVF